METLEQPKIDVKLIQEAANKAAEKAYLKEIEDYYTSYSSPFRKLIKKELEKQELSYPLELPNILETLNDSLKQEVDLIANNAIANTYVPMIGSALVGLPKEMKLYDILKLVIQEIEPDREDFDDFEFSWNKHEKYEWLQCYLRTPKNTYDLTLHHSTFDGSDNKYRLLGFPYGTKSDTYAKQKMTVIKDDVKIEMPFTPNILNDKVLKICFKLMLGSTEIEMNCDGFDEGMFPEEDHCHC